MQFCTETGAEAEVTSSQKDWQDHLASQHPGAQADSAGRRSPPRLVDKEEGLSPLPDRAKIYTICLLFES